MEWYSIDRRISVSGTFGKYIGHHGLEECMSHISMEVFSKYAICGYIFD